MLLLQVLFKSFYIVNFFYKCLFKFFLPHHQKLDFDLDFYFDFEMEFCTY